MTVLPILVDGDIIHKSASKTQLYKSDVIYLL